MRRLLLAIAVGLAGGACGGKLPDTHYYELSPPPAASRPSTGAGAPVLAIEPFDVEGAYDDERMVYRASPYRLNYYHYHRWSARPGVLVANQLERALERSGRFSAVVREREGAAVILGGRLVAIEEVDLSRRRWVGRIALELQLRDARSGEVLWTRDLEEREPLVSQSPEGLARALGVAMDRLAARVIPEVARIAAEQAGRAPPRG